MSKLKLSITSILARAAGQPARGGAVPQRPYSIPMPRISFRDHFGQVHQIRPGLQLIAPTSSIRLGGHPTINLSVSDIRSSVLGVLDTTKSIPADTPVKVSVTAWNGEEGHFELKFFDIYEAVPKRNNPSSSLGNREATPDRSPTPRVQLEPHPPIHPLRLSTGFTPKHIKAQASVTELIPTIWIGDQSFVLPRAVINYDELIEENEIPVFNTGLVDTEGNPIYCQISFIPIAEALFLLVKTGQVFTTADYNHKIHSFKERKTLTLYLKSKEHDIPFYTLAVQLPVTETNQERVEAALTKKDKYRETPSSFKIRLVMGGKFDPREQPLDHHTLPRFINALIEDGTLYAEEVPEDPPIDS